MSLGVTLFLSLFLMDSPSEIICCLGIDSSEYFGFDTIVVIASALIMASTTYMLVIYDRKPIHAIISDDKT